MVSTRSQRSNGLIERSVQSIKPLLKKADDSKEDAFLALLEFRNSLIIVMEQFPAELVTKLPTSKHLLKSESQPVNEIRQRLRERQLCRYAFYDRNTKALSHLHAKESVRNRVAREWKPEVFASHYQSPRSYIVKTQRGTELKRIAITYGQRKSGRSASCISRLY